MLRRRFVLALPFVLAAAPALAGEEKAPPKQPGLFVELQPVGLPIVDGGQLVNYVFVNVRVNLATGQDPSRWRGKEPFFRDALVRLGHRSTFNVPGDYEKIDAAKLCAALTREAAAITGPGVIRSVEVTTQTPAHRAFRRPS